MAIVIIKTENIFKRWARAFLCDLCQSSGRKIVGPSVTPGAGAEGEKPGRSREGVRFLGDTAWAEERRGESGVFTLHFRRGRPALQNLYQYLGLSSLHLPPGNLILYSHIHFYGAFIEVFNWKPNETSMSLKPSIQSGQITSNDSNDCNAMIAMFPFRQAVKRSRTK